MKVSKALLLEALKKCMPGVDNGNALLEGADAVVMEDGWIHSFNDSISISVPVPELAGLIGAVRAKEFYTVISKLSAVEIDITSGEKSLTISGGKANIEMTLLENSMKGRIKAVLEAVDTWEALPEDFKDALEACKFSCNTSGMAGIFVADGIMSATDEKRVNQWVMKGEMGRFWITDPSAGELMKFKGLSEYALSSSWLHIKTDTGLFFSCKRLADDRWPLAAVNRILAAHEVEEGDLSNTMPLGVLSAVERAAALYTDVNGFKAVQLSFSADKIEISSKHAAGKYHESVEWDQGFAKKFPPFKVFVEPSLVQYAFSRAATFYIKTITSGTKNSTRLVFTSDSFKHVMSTIDEGAGKVERPAKAEKPAKEEKADS